MCSSYTKGCPSFKSSRKVKPLTSELSRHAEHDISSVIYYHLWLLSFSKTLNDFRAPMDFFSFTDKTLIDTVIFVSFVLRLTKDLLVPGQKTINLIGFPGLCQPEPNTPACSGFLCLKTFAQKPLRQNQLGLAKARFELIKHEIQLIARAELSRRIKGRSLPPN